MLHAATLQVAQAQSDRRDGVLSGGPVACIDLHAHQLWVERLQRQRADAELALERAGAEVDARRSALVEARRRREALERLKERRRPSTAPRWSALEGAQLDEMALTVPAPPRERERAMSVAAVTARVGEIQQLIGALNGGVAAPAAAGRHAAVRRRVAPAPTSFRSQLAAATPRPRPRPSLGAAAAARRSSTP